METKERITKEDLGTTKEWLKESEQQIPRRVYLVIHTMLLMMDKLEPIAQRYKKILTLLAQSWDLSPSSEKVTVPQNKIAADKKTPRRNQLRSCLKKKSSRKTTQQRPTKSPEPQSPYGFVLSNSNASQEWVFPSSWLKEHNVRFDDLTSSFETQTTYDLTLQWTQVHNRIEVRTHKGTGKVYRAPNGNAPEGGKFTYGTMVNAAILHVGYQMPLTRIARYLSNAMVQLGKSTVYGFHTFIAKAFLPIFYVLCEELLKNARVIEADDFNTRINKKTSDFDALLTEDKKSDGVKILLDLHDKIGLDAQKVHGKGKKTKANLTVLSGVTDDKDPKSRIILKLTHLGGAGDLLGKLLLKYRSPKNELWLVSDLASSNVPRGEGIEKYHIRQQACLWHARRRFWRARDYDDDCWYAIRCFSGIADVEARIVNRQANEKEIARLRKTYASWFFKRLIEVSKTLLKKWGKESIVGEAAEYVLANEHTLRQFLKHPFLIAHNNRVERYGRPEKLMLSASKFRDTLAGRVVYDVISTVMATCCAARVDFYAYAIDVLRNRDLVHQNPSTWTPIAWSKRQQTIQK